VLRDPVERLVSAYTVFNMSRAFGGRPFHALPLAQMLHVQRRLAGLRTRGGSWYEAVAASGALDRCFVGVFELHDASYALLSLAAPWLGRLPGMLKVRRHASVHAAAAALPAAALRALRTGAAADYRWYRRARELMAQQLRAACECAPAALRAHAAGGACVGAAARLPQLLVQNASAVEDRFRRLANGVATRANSTARGAYAGCFRSRVLILRAAAPTAPSAVLTRS